MKTKETANIISQEKLTEGVYSMWLETTAAKGALPGQFISVYPNDKTKLLPRPISICEIDDTKETGRLRIVYRIAGGGTEEFSKMKAGDTLEILGPNGNGFMDPVKEEIKKETKVLLVGGGIGIPPMVALAESLDGDVTTVAGYRSKDGLFLTKELEDAGKLVIATDDGSFGYRGTVIDAIKEAGIACDMIFACGPRLMLKGIKTLAGEKGISAYISMEERMACGIGACLGCVCTSTDTDDHSKVKNKRICVDGPVFEASEVVL